MQHRPVGRALGLTDLWRSLVDVIDVTERLMAEFEDRLPLNVISGVVNSCRHDLQGTPSGPLPELLDRLARQRLADLLVAPCPSSVPSPRPSSGAPIA